MGISSLKKDKLDYVRVDLAKDNVTLTANKTDGNSVDFSSLVSANTPSGYEFDHLEFVGVWPKSSWTNVIVTRCIVTNGLGNPDLNLATTTTQNYIVKAMAWYRRII